jgi:hypothetical protein
LASIADEGDLSRGQVELIAGDRAAALDVIEQAAQHLGLAGGQAPTVKEFDEACQQLGNGRTKRKVDRQWGRSRLAVLTWQGEHVQETPRQRALRAQLSGRRSRTGDYFEYVRQWLATDPALHRHEDYEAWREVHNQQHPATPVVASNTMVYRLGLSWAAVVSAASGDDRVRSESPAPGELISTGEAQRLLGVDRNTFNMRASQDPAFPPSVGQIGGSRT